MCRRRSNLINNSIDSLPTNFIVRDVIERQYGNRPIARSTPQPDEIRRRLKKLRKSGEEKNNNDDEKDHEYMDYVKPAAAALVGVLGGLLLAKGVSKMVERKKKSDKWIECSSILCLSVWLSRRR